jgi:hypothetical protein
LKTRHLALAGALGATLLLVWLGGGESETAPESAIVAAVERPAKSTAQPAPPASDAVASTGERMRDSAIDLFAPRDWNPPPPPVEVKPARPEAPPLPYRYLGRWEENGALTLILGHGDLSIPVRSGQILDGQWRVDRISASRIDFTFLPLKTRAHLALEEPQ